MNGKTSSSLRPICAGFPGFPRPRDAQKTCHSNALPGPPFNLGPKTVKTVENGGALTESGAVPTLASKQEETWRASIA